MSVLEDELRHNFAAFHRDWTTQIKGNWEALAANRVYFESYRRLSAINALKTYLVIPHFSNESAAFFLEAHNDTLVSHVAASYGSWRSSLQSLRSCIENSLCAIYYKDHPIELALWSAGKLRLGFAELHAYVSKHPSFSPYVGSVNGLDVIKEEYATLSKAVHASATNFRMTEADGSVLLWNTETARAGMWASREKRVIEGICLLLICLLRDHLTGTKNSSLRHILYYSLSSSKRAAVKDTFHITISKPS